jgi:hypothetical protein
VCINNTVKDKDMNNRYPTEYKTREEAQRRMDTRLETLAANCPLRYRPAMIHGPSDGYMVVELGWALGEGHSIIS